jgi:hypothetical protein
MSNRTTDGNDEQRGQQERAEENVTDAVPPAVMPEAKPKRTHERSHAAHLQNNQEKPHTKPAIDMRESKLPGIRKQP